MTDYFTYFAIACVVALVVCSLLLWRNRRWGLVAFAIAVPFMGLATVGLSPLLFVPDLPTEEQRETASPSETPITHAAFETFRPLQKSIDGYVGAAACAECHKDNHQSWHDSYHRTMTQVATVDSVMGDFSDQKVSFDGHDYRLSKDQHLCWVEMPTSILNISNQPGVPEETSKLPLVMSTGSHHMQVYWFPMGKGRVLGQMPLVYLKEEQRWVPRRSCFLEPPESGPSIEIGRWNNTCLQCHTTHPKQQLSRDFVFDTTVAEFGISCEACHGPGGDHIQLHRSQSGVSAADPIVNPSQLDHRLSAQICGNCHSMSTHLDAETRNVGHIYRPGKKLDDTRHLYRCNAKSAEILKKQGREPGEFYDTVFWKDGTIRVSGREYNGLVDSPCYQKGTMSCITCHAVHQQSNDKRPASQWANDQLAIGMQTDAACTQCHDTDQYGQKHTHHSPTSAGSRCYNCHMPNTTYGLMKAMRSHTISSPDVAADMNAARPNACNLCHLDQSLGWAANHLHDWHETEKPSLSVEESELAAGVMWVLKGDAGIRAIVAWHMGWDAAQHASSTAWMGRYLAHLLTDPYDVVRYIAAKSLRTIAGFRDLKYDFVALPGARVAQQDVAIKLWHQLQPDDRDNSKRLLIGENGKLDAVKFQELAKQRDDRSMLLNE